MIKQLITLVLILFLPFIANASPQGSIPANSLPEVNIGVLQYGTVNWEVDVIKHHQLDKKYNFNLKVMRVGNKNASAVALQSQAVDIILGDWLWVTRQRFNQKNYTIFPTSIATGGLYIARDSKIDALPALKQLKVGIAGGAVDKNWLLLQAYSQKKYGFDIKNDTEPTFATPPLLNRLMLRGDLAAAINFWHYGARLKASGYELLVSVPQMLTELGIDSNIPLLGWIFDQDWAKQHSDQISGFLLASLEAKQLLYSSDSEWQRIRALTKAENSQVFEHLKNDYRAGVLRQFGSKELAASKKVFEILAQQAGNSLVGKAKNLSEGTFWQDDKVRHAVLIE